MAAVVFRRAELRRAVEQSSFGSELFVHLPARWSTSGLALTSMHLTHRYPTPRPHSANLWNTENKICPTSAPLATQTPFRSRRRQGSLQVVFMNGMEKIKLPNGSLSQLMHAHVSRQVSMKAELTARDKTPWSLVSSSKIRCAWHEKADKPRGATYWYSVL